MTRGWMHQLGGAVIGDAGARVDEGPAGISDCPIQLSCVHAGSGLNIGIGFIVVSAPFIEKAARVFRVGIQKGQRSGKVRHDILRLSGKDDAPPPTMSIHSVSPCSQPSSFSTSSGKVKVPCSPSFDSPAIFSLIGASIVRATGATRPYMDCTTL